MKSCWIVEGYSDNKGVSKSDRNIIYLVTARKHIQAADLQWMMPSANAIFEPVICDIDWKKRCLEEKKKID